jgi:putative nucleotidyltransferase with HDIG domain
MSDEHANYSPVSLSKIKPDEPLCADVYVKVAGKILKFKEAGDIISGEKYNFFLAKNVKDIYVETSDVQKVLGWIQEVREKRIEQAVDKIGAEIRESVELAEDMSEKVYDVYADETLSSQVVESLQNNVSDFVSTMSKNKISQVILTRLSKQNESIADHVVNTANIAMYIAMLCGHSHQFVLENIYLGALFHDYAKAKIPLHILEDPNNPLHMQAIYDHPTKGAEALKSFGLPDQVLSIVEQHHEAYNGRGYPKKLAGDDIYDLAKIVAIANVYDNLLTENKNKSEKERVKIAIKYLEYDKGKQEFDPNILPRVIEGLKLSYNAYLK